MFSLPGPGNTMEILSCRGPNPDEWEARTGALPSSVWLQKLNLGFCEGTMNSKMATKMATVASEAYLGREEHTGLAHLGYTTVMQQACSVSECSHVRKQAHLSKKTGTPKAKIRRGEVD